MMKPLLPLCSMLHVLWMDIVHYMHDQHFQSLNTYEQHATLNSKVHKQKLKVR